LLQIHHRLVDDVEFPLIQRLAQMEFHFQEAERLAVARGLEYLDAAAARVLGAGQRHVGVGHQGLRARIGRGIGEGEAGRRARRERPPGQPRRQREPGRDRGERALAAFAPCPVRPEWLRRGRSR
jgi:hypothetical protein